VLVSRRAKRSELIEKNILTYWRQEIMSVNVCYRNDVPPAIAQVFVITNNLFYFDRDRSSSPRFWVQGGCLYSGDFRTPVLGVEPEHILADRPPTRERRQGLCGSARRRHRSQCALLGKHQRLDTFYTFSGWQQAVGEDVQSVVQNRGFANPTYHFDNFSLPHGSPGAGFGVFDPIRAGRYNPLIHPPAVPATFPTKNFDSATDF